MSLADEIAKQAQAERDARRLEKQRETAAEKEHANKLRRLLTAENHRQDALRIIAEIATKVEVPKFKPPARPKKAPRHTWAMLISDWQLGQFNKLGATGGLYEQTTDITTRQVRTLWEVLCQLHDIDAHGKIIDELVIFDLGDLIEGDQMRPSQAAEIDRPMSQQAIEVLDLEAWLIQQALARFERVRVLKVGGNHDRLSPRPGNAGLGELGYVDTFSWVNGAVLQRMFRDPISSGRLSITNHETFFGTEMVANQRCVYEHGASFRGGTGSYGGVPYYPITNAARGYQEMLDGADLVFMGHWHRAAALPMRGGWGWQIINGALPPSSTWIQSGMKGVGRPCQLLVDLHPQQGMVGWRPIWLNVPGQIKPGEYWAKAHGKVSA